MTEAEWLACSNPWQMLKALEGNASDRKLRLFALAVCTQVASRSGKACADALEVVEDYASGKGDDADLLIAHCWIERDILPTSDPVEMDMETLDLGAICVIGDPPPGFNGIVGLADRFGGVELLRCIFNPYRSATVDPSWLTSIVFTLAQAMYDDRAFFRLPILADALEDAGCTNADILDHCRQPGEHVRGCWVVDLILGKQ